MKTFLFHFFFVIICASASLHAQPYLAALGRGDKSLLHPAATSIFSRNDVVAVQVRTSTDTLSGGQIRYKGLFNIGTAGDKPLLFLFPQEPFTSHFNVWIDGTVYSNDPFRTGALIMPLVSDPRLLEDNLTITCSYQAGGITIEQRLTPQQYSPTTGAIFIQYVITNNDIVPHQVGLLLELDTNVNGNDRAKVSTSFGYKQGEQIYSAPFIPDYFQAFETTDLDSTGVVAQGTLVGTDAVRPDLMIVGDWLVNLSKVQWDYTPQNLPFFDDSAVILRWNEQRLAPGENRIIATFYGLGDVSTQPGPLTLNLTAPNRLDAVAGQLTPNPFEVNLIVTNTGNVAADNLQATLDLPSGLSAVSGGLLFPQNLLPQEVATASWKVFAQCPTVGDTTLEFTVNVTAANVPANSVSRKIFIPSCTASLPDFLLIAAPKRDTVTAGQSATYTIGMQPSGGFTESITLSLFPVLQRVTHTFSPATISPATTSMLTLQTQSDLNPDTYAFAITGVGGGLSRSDTIALAVQAADTSPPFTTNHTPVRFVKNTPLDTEIMVEVHDAQAGVNSSTLTMSVNGTPVAPAITGTPAAYRLRYTPATPFRDNQPVYVQINARDLASPPNVMPEDSYFFTTVRDSLPPFAADHFPARGATNVPVDTKIEVRLRDLLTGVDLNSIVMRINDQTVSPMISGDQLTYLLSYQPPVNFRLDDTVTVKIDASDLASVPNRMPTEEYSFFIQPPLLLPDLAVIDLRTSGAVFVDIEATVIGEIANTGGVDVNGAFEVQFLLDSETQKDTTFSGLAAGARATVRLSLQFQTAGTHEVELVVDPADQISEETEANNRQKITVQVSEPVAAATPLIVRPNPFTPNNDGFNDRVEFDYSGLGLRTPALQIFDIKGAPIWSSQANSGAAEKLSWDGRDDSGRDVAPGVYLYTLRDQGNNVASGYVVVAR